MKAVHVVYAKWCPHCVPTTVEPVERAGEELGVPVLLHDIDTAGVEEADDLVKKYGDWTPDYVIPQVFIQMEDGRIEHVLTGDRRGVQYTKQAVEDLLKTKLSRRPIS